MLIFDWLKVIGTISASDHYGYFNDKSKASHFKYMCSYRLDVNILSDLIKLK